MIRSRRSNVDGAGATTKPPFGSCANAVISRSTSVALVTPADVTVTPSEEDADSAARKNETLAAILGSWTTATRRTEGAICLRTSSHFPPIAGSKLWNPVILPPGRARSVTNPLPTGSDTWVKTIGIVLVIGFNADTAGFA